MTSQVVILDLNEFVRMDKYRQGRSGLWFREDGTAAAKKFKVNEMTDPNVEIILKMVQGAMMDDSFLKAFMGPLARKVGPMELSRRVRVQGGFPGGQVGYRRASSTAEQVEEYFHHEANRIAERDTKKAKEAKQDWSEPMQFFIPDISTRVRLTEDWTFRLFEESRNIGFWEKLGFKRSGNRGWRYDNPMTEKDVTINAGSILSINRVYIRQGVSEYSSITFNLQKGAVVNGDADTFKKAGVRFWAKLSDVNKMKVEVDKTTLAEN